MQNLSHTDKNHLHWGLFLSDAVVLYNWHMDLSGIHAPNDIVIFMCLSCLADSHIPYFYSLTYDITVTYFLTPQIARKNRSNEISVESY